MDSLPDALGLSAAGLALVFTFVFLGALVQGAIGFGLNLVAVPAIAALRPDVLPAAAILFSLPLTLGSALREHAHVDRPAIWWTTVGRLPGVAMGAWVVSVLAPETLARVIGAMVLGGVAMSVVSPALRVDARTQTLVGLVSGLMGTASSIGGPPVALLYQRHPGPVVRSTLGAIFVVGTLMSIAALALAGQIAPRHWLFGGAMVPAVLLGLVASRSLHPWLDSGWLRPVVLAFSALSGLLVLLRSWIA